MALQFVEDEELGFSPSSSGWDREIRHEAISWAALRGEAG